MAPKTDSSLAWPTDTIDDPYQVTAGVAAVRATPTPDGEMVTHALHGETLILAKEDGDFALVRLVSDGYVGWVDLETISTPPLPTTHRVNTLRTYVFSEPDFRSAPRFLISMNGTVVVEKVEGAFSYCAKAGWVASVHLSPQGTFESSPALVAERFLETPFLWGGKESLGLDGAGLVQVAHNACGLKIPRKPDMMWQKTGLAISEWQIPKSLHRGDLIFWDDHVGLMLDAETVLHSSPHQMKVVSEPLLDAIQSLATTNGTPIGAKRIFEKKSGD